MQLGTSGANFWWLTPPPSNATPPPSSTYIIQADNDPCSLLAGFAIGDTESSNLLAAAIFDSTCNRLGFLHDATKNNVSVCFKGKARALVRSSRGLAANAGTGCNSCRDDLTTLPELDMTGLPISASQPARQSSLSSMHFCYLTCRGPFGATSHHLGEVNRASCPRRLMMRGTFDGSSPIPSP